MYNILFYGNCQPDALLRTLNLCNITYQTTYIPCHLTDMDEATFLHHILNSDVIITQPISNNYREKTYLSFSYIIKNAKQTTKIIVIDSCYFKFYYIDLTYKLIDNNTLREPHDYHYTSMINCFKNDISPEKYITDYVNNEDLITNEELDSIAATSLTELKMRNNKIKEEYALYENISIISIHDFVKLNYKEKLLFYSMNHPTKYVFQYICEEIIKYLNIPNTINYEIDALENPKCILYASIKKNVNFDISNCNPLLYGLTDILSITNLYYSSYSKLDSTKL